MIGPRRPEVYDPASPPAVPGAPRRIRLDAAEAARFNADLVATLDAAIEGTLDPLIPADEPVALLDAPGSPNVGDSAIWLGTLAYLRRRGIRALRYSCGHSTFSPAALARRLRRGTILLCGGGNLGDLYPPHQRLREEVIAAFPRHRIVQLPQSIHFSSAAALARARGVFDRHPDLVLVLREPRSLAIARNEFRATSVLCPDMAFALGNLPRPVAPTEDLMWLARDDRESLRGRPGTCESPGGVADPPACVDGMRAVRADWLVDTPTWTLRLNRFLNRQIREHQRNVLQSVLSLTYEPVARQRLARGCRTLARGRFVITDRLHGHILCVLLGIPHVVLDNSYGKVRGFYDAWTRHTPLAEWCDSEIEALASVRARLEPSTG